MKNLVKVYNVDEFAKQYEISVSDVENQFKLNVECGEIAYLCVSESDEIPYVGTIYTNNTCSIVGGSFDKLVSMCEMFDMLSNK